MPKLLSVQASPRGPQSISRALCLRFEEMWLERHEGGQVVRRDLMTSGIPYMDVDWIAGVYAPPSVDRTDAMRAALDLSRQFIDEMLGADRIVIGTPMYNYSLPAVLKSWIDYLVRPGLTFALAPGWPGLLEDRPVDLVIAARDEYDAVALERLDMLTPVVRRAFGFMGVRDVRSLVAGGSLGVNRGEVDLQAHISRFESCLIAAVERMPIGHDATGPNVRQ